MSDRRPIAAGNWKMNGLKASMAEVEALNAALESGADARCEVLLCPPFTLLGAFDAALANSSIQHGAQDCHMNESGAHTGDISAQMLKDTGCSHVIVGHSERRADHGEDDATVRAKADAVHGAGLVAIICVGETDAERDAGKALDIVNGQLAGSLPDAATAANTVVAYEPVWAIGTGRTPTPADVEEVHGAIRQSLVARFGSEGEGMRVLYGGSVKPSNAKELMSVPNVDGALVGGASLKAADFNGIIDAYR
ncbi:MAG: triose-phosphate isomerase [Sphingomonadales bacterium]|nr:triose-phosphate isomerase [Sphingomonadales bacterium]